MRDSKLFYKVQRNLLQMNSWGGSYSLVSCGISWYEHCIQHYGIDGVGVESFSPWELILCYLPRCLQSRAKGKFNSAIDLSLDEILVLQYKESIQKENI